MLECIDRSCNSRVCAKKQQCVLLRPSFDFSLRFFILFFALITKPACDGIWDVASSRQCSEFIQTLLGEGELDLGNICEEALDTCLDRKSRDNMTMMLVSFPGIKAAASGPLVLSNALWGHRSVRKTRDASRVAAEAANQMCISMKENGVGCAGLDEPWFVTQDVHEEIAA
jgi:hypothetical protein